MAWLLVIGAGFVPSRLGVAARRDPRLPATSLANVLALVGLVAAIVALSLTAPH